MRGDGKGERKATNERNEGLESFIPGERHDYIDLKFFLGVEYASSCVSAGRKVSLTGMR